MAERFEVRTVTCPPRTPQASAIETDLSFSPGIVTSLIVRIPPGHAFLTGIAIAQAHGISIPQSGNAWLIGDNETLPLDVEGFLNNGSWSVFTYNNDPNYAHTWHLRFHVVELRPTRQRDYTPIHADLIHQAAVNPGRAIQ